MQPGKLPPLISLDGAREQTTGTLAERLEQVRLRDFDSVWASLMARMKFGESEAVKFEACKLALAYMLGPPPKGDDRPSVNVNVGAGAQVSAGANQSPIPLDQMTPEELAAVRTLQLGMARRRNE